MVTRDLFLRPKVQSLTVLYIILTDNVPPPYTFSINWYPFTYIHDLMFYSVFLYEILKSMAFKYKNCKFSLLFCMLQIVKSVSYPYRVSHLVKSAIRNTDRLNYSRVSKSYFVRSKEIKRC